MNAAKNVTEEEGGRMHNGDEDKKNENAAVSNLLLKTAFWMALWYGTSLCTLFLNKIILEMPSPDILRNMHADNTEAVEEEEDADSKTGSAGNIGDGNVHLLGAVQMTTTAVLGGMKVVVIPYLQRWYRGLETGAKGRGRRKNGFVKLSNFLVRRSGYSVVSAGETTDSGDVEAQLQTKLQETERGQPQQRRGWGIFGNRKLLRSLAIVGFLRALTVLLGLLSLSHVAVSFVETVKSSAPLFTVIFAYVILGERTSNTVVVSLLPVMGGLILCSAYELSFDTIGFAAAVTNNCVDCIQNVMSKKLLSSVSVPGSKSDGNSISRAPKQSLTPAELQFYTSFSALVLQLPLAFRTSLPSNLWSIVWSSASDFISPSTAGTNPLIRKLYICLLIDATSYHLQSVSAYYTMSCVGPVTMSVSNTLKRAILIWMSVLYFGNPMSDYAVLGTVLVIGGVFWYNKARRKDTKTPTSTAALPAVDKSAKMC